LAEDDNLIKAFASGADIHQATAAQMFAKNLDEVDQELRSQAKAINYGIIYGMGPQRLSQTTGCSLQEAKTFIQKYFENFSKIKNFINSSIEKAQDRSYSETLFGRQRKIEGLDGQMGAIALVNAKNIAVNSPIQGTAADIMKLAMIRVQNKIKASKLKARMLLQVHDELVFECPEHEKDELSSILSEEMALAADLKVSLDVEIGSGMNWLEAH